MALATSLSAITLATKDMQKSVTFYDLLGLNKVMDSSEFVSYCIIPGMFRISLSPCFLFLPLSSLLSLYFAIRAGSN